MDDGEPLHDREPDLIDAAGRAQAGLDLLDLPLEGLLLLAPDLVAGAGLLLGHHQTPLERLQLLAERLQKRGQLLPFGLLAQPHLDDDVDKVTQRAVQPFRPGHVTETGMQRFRVDGHVGRQAQDGQQRFDAFDVGLFPVHAKIPGRG